MKDAFLPKKTFLFFLAGGMYVRVVPSYFQSKATSKTLSFVTLNKKNKVKFLKKEVSHCLMNDRRFCILQQTQKMPTKLSMTISKPKVLYLSIYLSIILTNHCRDSKKLLTKN